MPNCTHYLQIVYGVVTKIRDLYSKYKHHNETPSASDVFEFMEKFNLKYKSERIQVFPVDKHGFRGTDDDRVVLGIQFEIDDNLVSINRDVLQDFRELDEFFEREKYDVPKIHVVFSGCSCCS